MATTFKSGPRDPRTGQSSARISPDNVIRSDGYTDRERAESISILPEDPRRQNQMRVPEGAGTLQEFMAASGRSDTNPYGDSGLFGGGADFTNSMTPGQIDDVNRLAYNQYLGHVSGRGTQRGGIGDFIPGYAPALKIGSNTPSGRVVAAPTQPKQGGIADFFNLSPTLGILRSFFGRGNIPRTLDDSGVDYSTEGIETLDAAPVLKPGEAAAPALSPTLVSAQNNENLFGLERFMVPDGGVTTPDGMNPFRDILRTPVINPDIQSNMPVISGENIEEYRNRPLPGQERPMTPKMRRRMRFKSEFPFGI